MESQSLTKCHLSARQTLTYRRSRVKRSHEVVSWTFGCDNHMYTYMHTCSDLDLVSSMPCDVLLASDIHLKL